MIGKVLIVDDETAILSTLRLCLEKNGYEVTTTDSSEEALELVKEGNYRVSIVDICMPNINGLTLIRKFRAMQPDLGIVTVTGAASKKNILRAFHNGTDDLLEKPVKPQELIFSIERAIKARAGLRDLSLFLNSFGLSAKAEGVK